MKNILLYLLLFIGFSANAQRTCGSHTYMQDQLMANPLLQNQINAINAHAQQYVANGKRTRQLVTIPVVFHVVYKTAAENISDAACIANLAQLNLDFARLNADAANTPAAFAGVAANTDIQFCLAVRDPLGNSTTGITHTSTATSSWSTNNNIKFAASGGVDAWPRDQYLNIWVGSLGSSLLGYAQFPGGPAATDGVVVLNTSVGSQANPSPTGGSYNWGRTGTHEVGHWLGMYHIWGDDGGACPGTGGFDDNIADTPPQEDQNYGCPTYPLLDACATVAPGAMFMNYMDYVDDGCMNMFTNGQSLVMQSLFATGGFRAPLLNSLGCTPVLPCNGMPNAGSIAKASNDTLCSGSMQITLSGASVGSGISVQWQQSANGTTGWINAVGLSNNVTYSAPAVSGVMYYRCTVYCATSGLNASTNVVAVYANGVLSVSGGASLCAPGNVILTANGIGTFNWFNSATATTPVFTGNPFTTLVPVNTTYYVNTGTSTKYSVGIVDKNFNTNSTSTTVTNGLYFRVSTPLTIDTVFVYPGSAGTVVVNVQDSITSTSIGSFSMAVTAAQINTKVAMPIAIAIGSIGTYKMIASGTTTTLYRNSVGVVFPYSIPGVISIFRNLTGNAGNYRFFYDWKISAGCATALVPVPVIITPPSLSIASTPILCNGANATITVSTAGAGYNFLLNGAGSNTTGIFNTLAGTYTISASNAAGCSASSIYTIAQPTALLINVASVNNTSACNGSLTATATGGTGAIQYQIDGGAWLSSGAFTNLCTGAYTICARDANNCSVCSSVIVNSLNSIAVYANATTTCSGSANATITANVVGGSGPYQFKLNNGAFNTLNVFNNLGPGTYTITAIDVNLITNIVTATVVNSSLAITLGGTSAASAAACNGTLVGTASGGVSPYTYSLNAAAYNATFNYTNMCSGAYTLCVKDAKGCIVCNNYTVLIIVPIAMVAPIVVQTCPGSTNGSITVVAQFGTMPFTYQLNNGAFGAVNTFTNLAAGVYTITAKDANNITTSTIVNNNQSAGMLMNVLGRTDMSCFNNCNGNIASIATLGASPYSYTINGGTPQANGTFGNLCGGVYTIVAKDANNCMVNTVQTIIAPAAIAMSLAKTNIACNGMTNASIIVNAIGGTAPYQYAKVPNPYGTFNYFNGLSAGTYTFLLKDASNCKISDTGSVSEPPVLICTGATNSNNNTVTINATGGTPTYVYSINGASTTSNNVFTGLAAGSYSLMVTDSRGCQYVTAVVLQAPESIGNITFGKAVNIYPNPSNGIVTIAINSDNAIGAVQIKVLNQIGQLVAKDVMLVNGKMAEKTMQLTHLSVGSYTVQVIDEQQHIAVHKLVIQ
jgi:Pregnancy-associated plasma protein-A/Secretion system C-terminal sorting domain/Ig-like domain CHU_C associated/SprB repeat